MSSTPTPPPLHAYLFADPAAHSLSPAMHNAAFAWAGIKAGYRAVRVPAAQLAEKIAGLRQPEVLGANLSLPHKEAVLPLLDGLSEAARRIGAVNTVVNRDGHLTGDNTDAPGLLLALRDAGLTTQPGPVVVLGAGGAARAAVYAALTGLGRDVFIVNRTRARAGELAARWAGAGAGAGAGAAAEFQITAADLSEIPWAGVSLIINSTSAGLNAPQESPLPGFDFCQTRAAVYDMVYQPADTRLMQDARAAGLRTANGLGMLAQQARLAFAAWTGAEVPLEVFLAALNPDTLKADTLKAGAGA